MEFQLYINNKEVELDKNFSFPITKTFSSLSSPTDIISDYSKSVQIPITPTNTKIFGDLYAIDRIITNGDSNSGIYFNPLKRHKMMLIYNGSVIIEGYAKLESITNKYYTLNIVGVMGDIFKELSKYVFTDDVANPYKIPNYLPSIYYSWDNVSGSIANNQSHLFLQPNPSIFDCWGFFLAFNGAEDMEKDSFLQSNGSTSAAAEKPFDIAKFSDSLADRYPNLGGFDGLLKGGMYWWDYNEAKIFNFTPYIYCNKLIQVYKKLLEEKTNYTLDLDTAFFNPLNPHYANSIYTLNKLPKSTTSTITTEETPITISSNLTTTLTTDVTMRAYGIENNVNPTFTKIVNSFDNSGYDVVGDDNIMLLPNDSFRGTIDVTVDEVELNLYSPLIHSEQTEYNIIMNDKDRYIKFVFALIDAETQSILTTKTISYYNDYTPTGDIKIKVDGIIGRNIKGNGLFNLPTPPTFQFTIDSAVINQLSATYKMEVVLHEIQILQPFKYLGDNNKYLDSMDNSITMLNCKVTSQLNGVASTSNYIGYDTLFSNNFNLQQWVIDYTKKYGLVWQIDYNEKKVKILTKNTYFSNNKIVDLSDKIIGNITIKPSVIDSKYYTFDYEDGGGDCDKYIKENFGDNYGMLKLSTNNEFSNDSKEIYKKDKTAILSTIKYRNWNNMYNNGIFTFQDTPFVLPSFHSKEELEYKAEAENNRFFFRRLNNITLPNTLYVTGISTFEKKQNKYYYFTHSIPSPTGAIAELKALTHTTTQIPQITTYWDESGQSAGIRKSILFNHPSYTFGANSNALLTFPTIYDEYWKNWITTMYNENNKIITFKFHMPLVEFLNLGMGDFIRMGNNICFINKITDYDFNSEEGKIELISINDLNGFNQLQTTYNYLWHDAAVRFNPIEGDTQTTYVVNSYYDAFQIYHPLSGNWFTMFVNGEEVTVGTYKTVGKGIFKIDCVLSNVDGETTNIQLRNTNNSVLQNINITVNNTITNSGFNEETLENLSIKANTLLSTDSTYFFTYESTTIENYSGGNYAVSVNGTAISDGEAITVGAGEYTITITATANTTKAYTGYIKISADNTEQIHNVVCTVVN